MKLFRYGCFLLLEFFSPLLVLSEILNVEQNQLYWKKKGDEALEESLNIQLNENVAKNVILFVGDGLGPNTLTASRIYSGGENSQLSFENFPFVSLLKTYAVDATVPDSSCSATALFTGVKTNVEVTGVDAGVKINDCLTSLQREHRLTSVIDWAQQAGKDTGFVTTTRVTHATPSALYSHSANRKWECDAEMPPSASHCKDIARQLIEDEPGRNIKVIFSFAEGTPYIGFMDKVVIMGGGRQCLTWMITNKPNDPIESWACKRADGRDLISEWKKDKMKRGKTFEVLNNTRDLEELNFAKTDFVLGIFSNGHMMYEDKRDKSPEGMPSLKEMTVAAIKMLQKNKNGYFLMVEGGLIDLAHHRGHARRALEETVQYSEAIAAAVNMTSDDTLIIVTSDHSHNLNINGKSHTRDDILGIAMNSGVDGVPYTKLTYSTGERKNYQYEVVGGNIQRKDPTNYDTYSYDYSQQAGIVNDEATHGGADVSLFAKGPMAHLFRGGVHEQSYVAYVIAYAAKIGSYANRGQHKTVTCTVPKLKSSAGHPSAVSVSILSAIVLNMIVCYI